MPLTSEALPRHKFSADVLTICYLFTVFWDIGQFGKDYLASSEIFIWILRCNSWGGYFNHIHMNNLAMKSCWLMILFSQ